jgi:hypothetical protein
LNWWLERISDNISQLEHFKEKDEYFGKIKGETIQIRSGNFLKRNEKLGCCMDFGICLLKIELSSYPTTPLLHSTIHIALNTLS